MKLACVVHRYGADIAGGSEGHCRLIARRLAERHDVTVLTSCARDHITWKNEYPAGVSEDGPVRVRRFPSARRRSMSRFIAQSDLVFGGGAPAVEQVQWFEENGPDLPGLLEHLEVSGSDYDLILFWAFRYASTFFGLPLVRERAVLVPTAEEDAAIGIDLLGPFFTRPAGLVFLTPEEQDLVALRASRPLGPSCVIGSGLDPVGPSSSSLASRAALAGLAFDPEAPFLLYVGRVDPNKGCETLMRYFAHWHDARTGAALSAVPLVLVGPINMPVPSHRAIYPLGFVEPAVRDALYAKATVVMIPSPYESLSLALLEAWNHGRPAFVNGRCRVLKGQAQRANGALYYRSFDEFASGLDRLLAERDLADALGRNGLEYVDREYRWPHVMQTLEGFLAGLPRVGLRAR
jgi:glycosyltransferase involved in cell wall biosynthesis